MSPEITDSLEEAERPATSEREQGHLRMLQMIARASGIDLRAAGLLEGLEVATDNNTSSSASSSVAGDHAGQADAEGESNAGPSVSSVERPRDWSLVFVLKIGDAERVVGARDNIFRTIYAMCQRDAALKNANPWQQTFELRFLIRPGPCSETPAEAEAESTHDEGLNAGVGQRGSAIIRLLDQLHDLVAHTTKLAGVDELFVNRTISDKALRQLDDPLMVVCAALPSWCHDIVRTVPFLLSFESRMAFMRATCFGYARNINYWQDSARHERHNGDRAAADIQIPLGQVQRQKVRISRHRMLESALKVLDLYGTAKTILEVEYFDEAGSGIGPTLEFYATVSHCLQEADLGLWRDEQNTEPVPKRASGGDSPHSVRYVSAPLGLFPAPLNPASITDRDSPLPEQRSSVLPPEDRAVQLFKFTGHLVAKGLVDGRILDIPLGAAFWAAVHQHLASPETAECEVAWTWAQLEAVDTQLADSLRFLDHFAAAKSAVYARAGLSAAQAQAEIQAIRSPDGQTSVDDLSLDFTLPGHPSIELREGGAGIPVTVENIHVYIDLVARWTLRTGVRAQIGAFCEGFDKVLSSKILATFTPAELSSVAGQTADDGVHWEMSALLDSISAEHGFTSASLEMQMFTEFLASLNKAERREFLRFVTGSPRLPLGGFRSLQPPLTVVPRPAAPPLKADDYLPSVMTCANYIKLPSYSSAGILAQRWRQAMLEGQRSFHLS
ncbi:Ubiquitin fusion degradation protein 4 [Coemansia sp. RSA 552]|nr:Ubiquitin fusion degradation protein 4 [Coemansia sp. RSA 552]